MRSVKQMTYDQLQRIARANVIRMKREQGLSNAVLARMTGMSEVTVSMVMSGKRSITLYTLWALSNAFGVNIRELLRNGKNIRRQ